MRINTFIILGILLTIFSSCATTMETHPTRVSVGDLVFGRNRLDEYIESRREKLAVMQKEALDLEKRLQKKEQELAALDHKLRNETTVALEVERKQKSIEKEVLDKQFELGKTTQDVVNLRQKLSHQEVLLGNAKEENKRQIREAIAAYEIEIEDLESEVSVLERAVDRILTVRTKHALETE